MSLPVDRPAFDSIVEAFTRWVPGDREGAARLRALAAASSPPTGRPESPVARALALAVTAYRRRKPGLLLRSLEDGLEPFMAPFMGDPAIGEWPYADPYHIDDLEGCRWLELLGHAALPGPPERLFVGVFFRTRSRVTWVPASHALARLALADAEMRAMLTTIWHAAFPTGLPKGWPKASALGEGRVTCEGFDPADTAHIRRHALDAACRYVAVGGDADHLPGFDIQRLASLSLPHDEADASAILNGLSALVESDATRALVAPGLARTAGGAPHGALVDNALRACLEAVEPHIAGDPAQRPLAVAIRDRLVAPTFLEASGAASFDWLWSWLENAVWARARNDTVLLARFSAAGRRVEPTLRLALDRAIPTTEETAVGALTRRLMVLFDESTWQTTDHLGRATALCDVLVLLDDPGIRNLPWPHLVARAIGSAPAEPLLHTGAVGEGAVVDLIARLAARDYTPDGLMRRHLGTTLTLKLAGLQKPRVATAVAVETELLLRERTDPADQVRLLWQILQRDPPAKTFRELCTSLRGERTPLHGLVKGLGALDDARDNELGMAELACRYRQLAALAESLAHTGSAGREDQDAHDAESGLEAGVAHLRRLADTLGPLFEMGDEGAVDAAWLGALGSMLTGPAGADGGLTAWLRWLGQDPAPVEAAWHTMRQAIEVAESALPTATTAHCSELQTAIERLRDAVARTSWPERRFVDHVLDRVSRWHAHLQGRARAVLRVSERTRALLDQGDTRTLIGEIAHPGTRALALADDARAVYRHLLERLRLWEAERYRRGVVGHVKLPAVTSHLTPLLAAVAGGPFLVLDFGTLWGHVTPDPARFGLTLAVMLGGSLALLVGDISSRVGRSWAVVWRAAVLWGTAYALALAASALVLALLPEAGREFGTEPVRMATLWGALSLFLGIFITLVLQGRRVVKGE